MKFSKAVEKSKIKKSKVLNPPKQDWIKRDIIQGINKRNAIWKKFKKHPENKEIEQQFKKERNKVAQHIQNCKKEYYYKAFRECSKKPRKMWDLINSLSKNKYKDPIKLPRLQTTTGILTNPIDICNYFNNFFATIGQTLAKEIPKKYHENSNNCYQSTLDEHVNELSELAPATPDEISTIIDSLDPNTSSGIDNMTIKSIKCVKNVIVKELTACINRCLEQGDFPDNLKVAKVSPVYKSGCKSDPGNYRPISVLPVLSKVFERIIYKRLNQYLAAINFLCKNQYGFRHKSNTLSATIDLVTKIKTNIDKKKNCSWNLHRFEKGL